MKTEGKLTVTRLGITYDEVAKTAEDILTAGENPTIERVRRVLGTGSNSTIAKYLQNWRSERLLESRQKIAAKNTAPDAVNAAVAHVWEKIRLEAETEIKAVREDAMIQIEIAQKERDEAIKSRELLQEELETLNNRFNQLSAEKEIAYLDLKTQEHEHHLLQEQYHHLENQHHTFKDMMHDKMTIMTANHQHEMNNKNNEIENIKEAHDKTLNKLVESYENNRQEHLLTIDRYQTEDQRNRNKIERFESAMNSIQQELAETQSHFKITLNERDSMIKMSHLKDDIIKEHEQNKKTAQVILSAIETLKDTNQSDFQSIILTLQQSTDDLRSISQSIFNWIKQKELIEQA
jgi:plasmid replication DNA-binding protein KfrA